MHRSIKIICVTVAACISLIYIGSFRVKAVSAGAVLGAEGISAAVSFLLSTIFTDSLIIAGNAAEQANYTVTVTTDEAQQILDDYFYSFNIDSLEGIDDYNCLMTITDPNQFLSYCGVSDPISLSGAQRTVYSSLQCTHNQVLNRKIITSAKGLVLQPISFSELLNDTSADLISYFSKSNVSVSVENGLRTLTISGETLYFSELAEQYGASMVWRGDHILPSGIPDVNYYVCFLISYKNVIYAPTRMYHSFVHHYYTSYLVPNTLPFAGFSYETPRLNSDLNYRVINWFTYPDNTFDSSYFFSINSRDCFSVSSGSCLFDAVDSDDPDLFRIYAFFFPNSILSDKFISDMTSHSVDVDTSDIEKDNVSTYDIPGSVTVPEVVADYYGGEKDIVVNPGAVMADDGTTTYDPSITIDDTDVQDVVDTPDFNEWVEQNNFVPALSNPDFELYDQCKDLLNNLFNYNDVNTPPSFKFYYDSNNDGISETYDVLDLSVLETTLSNDNMQDKSWWGTDIKVIDVIRYVIAAILYGLFIMRLIKRLPTFYGSGPWADM